MVHYIRVLKKPQVFCQALTSCLKCLITVTTDLGDSFYAEDISLHATIVGPEDEKITPWTTTTWKAHMRALWIQIENIPRQPHSVLLISSRQTTSADPLDDNMPQLLSARLVLDDTQQYGMLGTVQRHFHISPGKLVVHEGMGETIARHIW